ncbi:MAG: hypothetical protein IKY78_01995 [Clostridia bacterium]|nr:hypothetical protein [Clostridia bacterium]
MKSDVKFLIELAISFIPFILFAIYNSKANIKKENRNRQYPMPFAAVIYTIVVWIFMSKLATLFLTIVTKITEFIDGISFLSSFGISEFITNLHTSWGIYFELIIFNVFALVLFIIFKGFVISILSKIKITKDSFVAPLIEIFYSYDEEEDCWYIRDHLGQARTYIKTVYYATCFAAGLTLMISCALCMKHLVSAPFYPVFAVIIIGEMAFFVDGIHPEERKSSLTMQADKSRHVAMYPLLRKPLRTLFGDKLSAEGTTVNNGGITGGAIEDVLAALSEEGGHLGKNYAAFIRRKMEIGLKPNVDYVRCGYDLATGKSLLFNTPFYDKLNPYLFYAMNRELMTGGKIMVVLGRHATEDDLQRWISTGMKEMSNIPDFWKVAVLSGDKVNEDELPDIGIISRSGVHDLDIHKNNLSFLRKVSFVFVVEPSRLVTTAQIGLNLLIKNCGSERPITFCSVDRNCDGLVDALSHILMTNITEVNATEYPHGMSSYMYWTVDDDYVQHRIIPGVSRFLGMGTELSMVALKNQVKKAVWYGGEAFPVKDAHWIAKQYYYDLLDYANLPTNQETFDKSFQTSFNMCDERVNDYSFITVEDDRYNLFETRRNFATIAEQQGFVNVISSEYMLREYMSTNTELFTADAKAIPYITADYARTKRNAILSLCLLLCVDSVQEEVLDRQMTVLNIETDDPVSEIWKEICVIFGDDEAAEKDGTPILSVRTRDGKSALFHKDETIIFKRAYSVESGKFESVYTIENADFSRIILDDLQNASYIAEQESKDIYIGTELKGHVYQKYMPGQFFTLNGKYYEMVSTATDNRILVRRASEHIGGRLAYRQVRNYTIHNVEDSSSMGELKSVNNIDIHYQYADFSVETPGYWKLRAYNDFDNGDLVKVNGVPEREYHHKQILKFDFSKLGDAFTDSVRMTLTNLLNEVFVTLFADNQPFISAVTPGSYDAPLTYSLALDESIENADKCIFIIEDSQLDIGLLIAVERNVKRILQIVSDYLAWNDEMIAESIRKQNETPAAANSAAGSFDAYADDGKTPAEEKKGFFGRIGAWFKNLFKKKDKSKDNGGTAGGATDGLSPKERKKAEKAAKKAAKKAEKEAKKAAKKAKKQGDPASEVQTANEPSTEATQAVPTAENPAEGEMTSAEEISGEEITSEEITSEEFTEEAEASEGEIAEGEYAYTDGELPTEENPYDEGMPVEAELPEGEEPSTEEAYEGEELSEGEELTDTEEYIGEEEVAEAEEEFSEEASETEEYSDEEASAEEYLGEEAETETEELPADDDTSDAEADSDDAELAETEVPYEETYAEEASEADELPAEVEITETDEVFTAGEAPEEIITEEIQNEESEEEHSEGEVNEYA